MTDKLPDSLIRAIEAIPGESGWWKRSSRDGFRQSAMTLLKYGMPEEEIATFLTGLYYDAAECFGG